MWQKTTHAALVLGSFKANHLLHLTVSLVSVIFLREAIARPRPPLPPSPEMHLNGSWRFDAPDSGQLADQENVFLQDVAFCESFSGYSLGLEGNDPKLCFIPMSDGTKVNVSPTGTIRFWITPTISTLPGNSTANPATRRLLTFGVLSSQTSAELYALELNGPSIVLLATSLNGWTEILSAPAEWPAGEAHQVALSYSEAGSWLFIDGTMKAQGPPVVFMPPQVEGVSGITLGGDMLGLHLAQAQFDELATFYHTLGERELALNYACFAKSAAMGPITPEEDALRWQRMQTVRAQRGLYSSMLRAGGGGQLSQLDSITELSLNFPVWESTNLLFGILNPTPECSCILQYATNLHYPTYWTNLAVGTGYETNFTVAYSDTNQGYFRLRYKPYLFGTNIEASENIPCSITNLQVLEFEGTNANLSLAVTHGSLSLVMTNGLVFTAGANGTGSFTVVGLYSSVSTAASNLIYWGTTNYYGPDSLAVNLYNIGTNSSCYDNLQLPIYVQSPPIASNVTYYGIGMVYVADPGILQNCFDPEGDTIFAVSTTEETANGYLYIGWDGTISYVPNYDDVPVWDQFQYYAIDSRGCISAPATLTIYVSPTLPDPPGITLMTPTNNSAFIQYSNINVSASITSSDPACPVTAVAFYDGTNLIGTAATTPYSCVWSNAPPGAHLLKAVAATLCSLTGTSSVVTATVEADSDGDGVSDNQEVLRGTDPYDYYNGGAPCLEIVSGNWQSGGVAQTLAQYLRGNVKNTNGIPLYNAPVTFTIAQGGGFLSATNVSNWQSSLTVRSGANGMFAAKYKLPVATNSFNYISAAATVYTNSIITFVAVSTNVIGDPVPFLEVYTPLK